MSRWLALFALAIVSLPTPGAAVQTARGNTVRIDQALQDDLLAAGQHVQLRAAVQGDVALAGADVRIEQAVRGYVLAAGKNVEINGPIQNDLWATGETIRINAPIGDNGMLAGRRVEIHSNSAVRGDAGIAGDTVVIEGRSNAISNLPRERPASVQPSAVQYRLACNA